MRHLPTASPGCTRACALGCGAVRGPRHAQCSMHRSARRSAAAEGRRPARLRARTLLPRPPEWQPMGLKRARQPTSSPVAPAPARRPACGAARRVALLPALPLTPRAAPAAVATRHPSARCRLSRGARSCAATRAHSCAAPAGGWATARRHAGRRRAAGSCEQGRGGRLLTAVVRVSCNGRMAGWPARQAGPGAGPKEALRGGGCRRRVPDGGQRAAISRRDRSRALPSARRGTSRAILFESLDEGAGIVADHCTTHLARGAAWRAATARTISRMRCKSDLRRRSTLASERYSDDELRESSQGG